MTWALLRGIWDALPLWAGALAFLALWIGEKQIERAQSERDEARRAYAAADAEANGWVEHLYDIAEYGDPSMARQMARDALNLPYSEWPR